MQLRLRIKRNFRPAADDERLLWPLRLFQLTMGLAGETVWTIELYYKRVLVFGAFALAAGYAGGSLGLYWWLTRNPHNQVGIRDVLKIPVSRADFRRKLGNTAITTGIAQLREKDYVSAYHNLRTGLSRAPDNHVGRLLLARWISVSDPRQAMFLLEKGLAYSAARPDYVAGYFSFCNQVQAHRKALEHADLLLAGTFGPLPDAVRLTVLQNRALLLARTGRVDEGLATLAGSAPPAEDAAAQLGYRRLHIDILLQAGRADQARELFERTLRTADIAVEDRRRDAEIAIAQGDADRLQSALRHLRAARPDDPTVYAFAFSAWQRMNRLTFRDAAEQEYYRLFGSNDGAMQAFAAMAVNLDEPQVVARCRQVALANRLNGFAYGVHLTEIALRRGDFEQAMRLLRDWEALVETLKGDQKFYPEFIRRLTRASFAPTEELNEALLAHLGANRFQARLSLLLAAVRTLEKAGNTSGLQKILQLAQDWYPDTDELLAARERLDQQLAAATAAKPPTAPAAAPVEVPATAGDALAGLDAMIAGDDVARATGLLRAIRSAKPAWLPDNELELALREIELAFVTLDREATRSLVRRYLDRNRGEDEALRLVALARKFIGAGRAADARLLHDEIALAQTQSVRLTVELRSLELPDEMENLAIDREASIAALDRAIEAKRWGEGQRLIDYLRKQAPRWTVSAEVDLKVREIRIRLGLYQRPLALTLYKELVIKPGVPRSAAFRLVRDYIEANDRETALLLAREVLRLMPGDPAAEKLLREALAPNVDPPED